MREIKFRAWNKKERKMYLVAKIIFAYLRVICYEKDKALIGYEFNFKDIILIQYTGLKDKNGKEIWEGDVVLVKPNMVGNCIGKIRWSERSFAFLFDNGSPWGLNEIPPTNKHTIEIIGNIYENPELLERR